MFVKLAMKFLPPNLKRLLTVAQEIDLEEIEGWFDLAKRMFSRLDTREERMFVIKSWVEKQKSDGYMSGPELLQWGKDAGLTTKLKGKKAPACEPIVAPTN
jgi:hypothetical protein